MFIMQYAFLNKFQKFPFRQILGRAYHIMRNPPDA